MTVRRIFLSLVLAAFTVAVTGCGDKANTTNTPGKTDGANPGKPGAPPAPPPIPPPPKQ